MFGFRVDKHHAALAQMLCHDAKSHNRGIANLCVLSRGANAHRNQLFGIHSFIHRRLAAWRVEKVRQTAIWLQAVYRKLVAGKPQHARPTLFRRKPVLIERRRRRALCHIAAQDIFEHNQLEILRGDHSRGSSKSRDFTLRGAYRAANKPTHMVVIERQHLVFERNSASVYVMSRYSIITKHEPKLAPIRCNQRLAKHRVRHFALEHRRVGKAR